ncbi:MAG: ClpXP protease specificity-enhancing factor SspB [Polyangiaceae bacterium]|jgi:stringent starvation protein B|nr:ClpXP protease specificity-enhancing factor SspB [Polyangiaceae bacterium]
MSPPHSKRDVLRFLLDQGQTVRITLDARYAGVVLPARFLAAPQLMLEIGRNMIPPIPDLDIEGDAVRCTLSFAKQPFHCTMPWGSIWSLIGKRDGRGYHWVEDMPAEMVAIPQPPPPPRMPVSLRALPAEPVEPDEAPAPEVHPAPAEAAEAPAPAAALAEAAEPAAAAEASPPPRDEPEAPAEGKKKRALPSYLRVVK